VTRGEPLSHRWKDVRCIAFDAVGTLIYPEPSVADVYFAVAQRHGSRVTREETSRRFARALQSFEHEDGAGADRWATSEARERDRWTYVVAEVIDDVADVGACFDELFQHFARPSSWRCFPDVGDALTLLARQRCRLAVASNFDDRLNAICDRLPELQPLRLRAISSLVGHRKPSPQFYRALAEIAGCPPETILMVGDDFENDIRGARDAGCLAVALERRAKAAPPTSSSGARIEYARISSLHELVDLLVGS
jgi:putative hydrolase of the HAD superfamily